jgi:peptidoglycan hydrolase-like protein with peptidoglycan-binding domain
MLVDAIAFALFFSGGKRTAPAPDYPHLPPPPPPPAEPQKPAPRPAPPPVFPSPTPASLPPFPGPGWCFDEPPPQEVVDRAWALLPSLWAKGSGATAVELVGGRWIGFQASMMGTKKGVTAWRSTGCGAPAPAAEPVTPAPVPTPSAQPASVVTPPAPTPTVPPHIVPTPPYVAPTVPAVVVSPPASSPAANPYGGSMSTAQVQAAVNKLGYTPPLVVDGIYGAKTTDGVKWAQGDLNLSGYVPVLVVDGKAGPKTQDMLIESGATGTPIPAASPAPAASAPLAPMTNKQIQAAVNQLGYAPPLTVDGSIGPKSIAGIKWAQQHANAGGYHPPLAVDGVAGPLTQAYLESIQTA